MIVHTSKVRSFPLNNPDHLCGVMISVLASSVEECGINLRKVSLQDYMC